MGLASKLGAQNAQTAQQLSTAQSPVSVGGYNQQNVPAMPSAPPMTREAFNSVVSSGVEAQTDVMTKTQPYRGNLQKPLAPTTGDQAKDAINRTIVEKMWRIISVNRLHDFYTQQRLQVLVDRACKHDYLSLQKQWNIATMDMTLDLAVLGLYDIVLLADDSGSMNATEPSEDNMTRYEVLKQIVKTLSFWASLMDADGMCVRFLNSSKEGNGITSASAVDQLMNSVSPNGGTPMGEMLKDKVIDKMLRPVMMSNNLDRPILVIVVTDGAPNTPNAVVNSILEAKAMCVQSKYGENAIEFSFAQVGSDSGATAWLNEIDKHPQIGSMIDCTSNYPIEKEQCRAKYGIEFTESMWLVKLMIGAIDPMYDGADESPVGQTQSFGQQQQFPNVQQQKW